MMGPLAGLRILEIAGIGPGPFCAMMLADNGADVIRIDRPAHAEHEFAIDPAYDVLGRGRRSVAVDLKTPAGQELLLKMVEQSDALIEGFRPGVMERLGLGPGQCMGRNPKLVYGRMTGWGQDGPMAQLAGHDINYIALAGALHGIGRSHDKPVPPLNLVGDYGGGGMLLAFGLVCALLEAAKTGKGQVIDAAMVDGAALLTSVFHGLAAAGKWQDKRGSNLLDSGAHFYEVYTTRDEKYISIGALEPQFYSELLQRTGLATDPLFQQQMNTANWPVLKDRLEAVFKTRTQQEWIQIFAGSDACFAPVLSMDEAGLHPHLKARQTYIDYAGITQPAPAPRFSRTRNEIAGSAPWPGANNGNVLAELGLTPDDISQLIKNGAIDSV